MARNIPVIQSIAEVGGGTPVPPTPGSNRPYRRLTIRTPFARLGERSVREEKMAMIVEIKFFFYLAAVVCFVVAALPTRGPLARVNLTPLGLALFVFPTLWDVGVLAF